MVLLFLFFSDDQIMRALIGWLNLSIIYNIVKFLGDDGTCLVNVSNWVCPGGVHLILEPVSNLVLCVLEFH